MILTGDVGGTKTLLALHDDAGAIVDRRLFSSHESSAFGDLVARFLDGAAAHPRAACFGIAGPVIGDRVKVTHLPWEIDAGALAARFGLRRVRLLNDFAAAAHGIAALGPGDLVTLQAGEPMPERPKVVLGAGTGLGLAYMLDDAVLSGEAGHASFAPANAAQGALWQWLQRRHGRVHVEQVVSGAGLVEIDDFLRGPQQRASGNSEPPDRAAAIAHAALVDGDAQALAAVDLFLACFGAVAGDHALTVLARGGVYLAGGIAPKLLPRMLTGGFIASFNDKGTFSVWTRTCPVHVVVNSDLPLLGAARVAQRDAN